MKRKKKKRIKIKPEKKNNAEERAPALEAIATTAAKKRWNTIFGVGIGLLLLVGGLFVAQFGWAHFELNLIIPGLILILASIPAFKKRWNTNTGVGIGALLQMGGLFVALIGWANSEIKFIILGLVLILVSIPVFIWGCMNYAESKGYSKELGLVGLLGFIGLTVLVLLPEKVSTDLPVSRLKDVGRICMLVGWVIFVWGLWAFSWVQTQKSSYPLSLEQRQKIALAESGFQYKPGTTDIEPLGWYKRALYGMRADGAIFFIYVGGCLVYISLFMIIYRRNKPQPEGAHET
jgi:hypothetical protein